MNKINYSFWLMVIISFVLITCWSEDGVGREGIPYATFRNVLKDIRKEFPTFLDLDSIPIPEFMKGSDDENIKGVLKFIDDMNDVIENPLGIQEKALSEKDYDEIDGPHIMITPAGQIIHITYKWTENNGKLKIECLFISGPEGIEWRVIYNGEDEDGNHFDDMLLQWHFFSSEGFIYQYYTDIDFNWVGCPNPKCGWGLLFRDTYEKDVDNLDVFTSEIWSCGVLECFYHINVGNKMTLLKDGTKFETYAWDMENDRTYLWIVYTIYDDKTWYQIVYNSDGTIYKYEKWPPE